MKYFLSSYWFTQKKPVVFYPSNLQTWDYRTRDRLELGQAISGKISGHKYTTGQKANFWHAANNLQRSGGCIFLRVLRTKKVEYATQPYLR
jgi:hypothetical protein